MCQVWIFFFIYSSHLFFSMLMLGHKNDVSLSVLVDNLLDYFHKLISELRVKDYKKEGWQDWYARSDSGQLLRQTSSAICMLNEIIYGLSDQSISLYSQLFSKSGPEVEYTQGMQFAYDNNQRIRFIYDGSTWKVRQGKDVMDHIIHCIGSILHEYLSPEVWDLPSDQNSPSLEQDAGVQLSLHLFRDITMLHQEIYCDHLFSFNEIYDLSALIVKCVLEWTGSFKYYYLISSGYYRRDRPLQHGSWEGFCIQWIYAFYYLFITSKSDLFKLSNKKYIRCRPTGSFFYIRPSFRKCHI